MNVAELIERLSQLPAEHEVRTVVVEREGIFVDPVVGRTDSAFIDMRLHHADGGVVWIAGASDGTAPPAEIDHHCHCGIIHALDTSGTGETCTLPSVAGGGVDDTRI